MVNSESSKLVKASRGSIYAIDRISNLPEPLISRILSLLPTKCAVATSVLSTRWKFLWTSITNLDFDSYVEVGKYSNEAFRMKTIQFTNFVSRVLLLLNPPSIQKFRLKCSQHRFDPSSLYSWIWVAFGRTVEELDISLWLKEPTKLPLSHISCNVVVLKLEGIIHFNIPAEASVCFPSLQKLHLFKINFAIASNSSVNFPNLKFLHLNYVRYANEDSVHKLFSNCPVLENLVIERDDWDNLLCLIIRIPSLISLDITLDFEGTHDRPYKLQLDTPSLQYLNLEDDIQCQYLPMKNFYSLLQANVKLILNEGDDDNVESCTSFIKFLGNLSNVKFLSVAGDALQVFWTTSTNILPCFNNLTRLELETHFCGDTSIVINTLLERMDNLEHLVINGYWNCFSPRRFWWIEPPNVPKCLLVRVTTISLTYMHVNCCDQFELLRYFMKNAEVLQLLRISTFHNPERGYDFLRKISMFPRGSRTCQVDFN